MPFRLRTQPEHPLEPLAEQGRFLLGLLHQRQQEKKDEAYRDRQMALEEQREKRLEDTALELAKSHELQRQATLADLQRQGYAPAPTTGGQMEPTAVMPDRQLFPQQPTAQERMAEAIGERVTGIPAPDEREYEQPAAPRFTPIQFGEGLRYDPVLALEMADRAPEYVQAQREERQARERHAMLAEAMERAGLTPDWATEAVRQDIGTERVIQETLEAYRQQFEPTSYDAMQARQRVQGLMRVLDMVRQRATKAYEQATGKDLSDTDTLTAALMGKDQRPVGYDEIERQEIAKMERELGWQPGDLTRVMADLAATGQYEPPYRRKAPTGFSWGAAYDEALRRGPTDLRQPQPLPEEELAALAAEYAPVDEPFTRKALKEVGYSDDEIQQVLDRIAGR